MDGDETLPPTPPEEYAGRNRESSTEVADPIASTATSMTSSFCKDDFSIFPPSLHEGIYPSKTLILARDQQKQHQEEEEEEEDEEEHEVRRVGHVSWRQVVDSGIYFVRSKISGGRRGGVGATWSFVALAGFAGILIYMRQCHRQERRALFRLVLDKDKKIAQLMQQVAQMNEVISSGPRVSY